MLQCPKCSATLEQDFGMVTCSNCQAVLSIDLDGQVHETATTEQAEHLIQGEVSNESSSSFDETQSPAHLEAAPVTPGDESSTSDQAQAPFTFQDVVDFGNADSDKVGALRYNLVILGLESSESRAELEEVLAAPSFKFEVKDLMKNIRQGRLEIKGLQAAKAIALAHRLLATSLSLSWEQTQYDS